jgi:hypothetical protein
MFYVRYFYASRLVFASFTFSFVEINSKYQHMRNTVLY